MNHSIKYFGKKKKVQETRIMRECLTIPSVKCMSGGLSLQKSNITEENEIKERRGTPIYARRS